nr:YbjQ family protein [Aliidiomarina shirensis]
MRVVTTETIAGREISETLGIVRGNTIRARHVGRDILAGLRNIVGGELHDYTKLMAESREQSIDRMIDEARALGADAIVGVRFSTSVVATSAAEILVFGTAVKLAP